MQTQKLLTEPLIPTEHQSHRAASGEGNIQDLQQCGDVFVIAPVSAELLGQIEDDVGFSGGQHADDLPDILFHR